MPVPARKLASLISHHVRLPWLLAGAVAACLWLPLTGSAAELPALRPEQVQALLKTLAAAPSQGFGDAFDTAPYAADLSATDDARRQRAERRLEDTIIAYARAEHGLRVPRGKFEKFWAIRPAPYDAKATFAAALDKDQLEGWLAALEPPFPAYKRLVEGYSAYAKAAAAGGWKPLPHGGTLRQGMRGPAVAALRERLAAEPTLGAPQAAPTGSAGTAETFDAALTDAVKRCQLLHGLPATGTIGADTRAALDVPAADRVRQIAMNLERWRWLSRDRPASRVEVNTAADTFTLYDDDKPTLQMPAAAGKPVADDETPILASVVTSIIFNPPWNVPDDIATRELFPKERRDHHYFEREDFHIRKPGTGTRLVQAPGPKNALGRIKFDFKNPFGVYMHDTPERAAFGSTHRAVSHGCVRLEKPAEVAVALLNGVPDWSPDRVAGMAQNTQTVDVPLAKPMPIELLYFTAFADGDAIAFRRDIYGWDARLAALLATGADARRS